jgi:hypothetical protein
MRTLAALAPVSLGLMHGPAYTGDCAQALFDLNTDIDKTPSTLSDLIRSGKGARNRSSTFLADRPAGLVRGFVTADEGWSGCGPLRLGLRRSPARRGDASTCCADREQRGHVRLAGRLVGLWDDIGPARTR